MKLSRRDFLKYTGCGLTMGALATQFEHFGLMSALAQKVDDGGGNGDAPSDYRALVCVFMSGGNDGNNTVIPNHNSTSLSNYSTYFNARNPFGLAIPQANLLPISVGRAGGLNYGLHPNLGAQALNGTTIVNNGIHELWAQNKMAIVPNVGTLVQPTTRTQYLAKSVPLPYQLFSHSDQVTQYQTGIAGSYSFTGWGGRLSDKMSVDNNPGGLVPMITSINGAQIFTAGQFFTPLAINNANTPLNTVLNPSGFNGTATANARLAAFNSLRQQDLDSQFVAAASHVTDQAMTANAALSTFQEVATPFPTSGLGSQLKQVARLIKKRGDLAVQRQIFYCQLGSFDTHNTQLNDQGNLLTEFSQAVRAFNNEMEAQGISQGVTLFTMSDFGRTFNPAGTGATSGSDHAWGNHLFVVGGALSGANFYGVNASNGTPYPTLQFAGPDDSDNGSSARGRWIPTTSVEQYAATLARWYGLPDTQLNTVFPNLANFNGVNNLGFMTA